MATALVPADTGRGFDSLEVNCCAITATVFKVTGRKGLSVWPRKKKRLAECGAVQHACFVLPKRCAGFSLALIPNPCNGIDRAAAGSTCFRCGMEHMTHGYVLDSI